MTARAAGKTTKTAFNQEDDTKGHDIMQCSLKGGDSRKHNIFKSEHAPGESHWRGKAIWNMFYDVNRATDGSNSSAIIA